MEPRRCGECTACCTTTWVPELRKPGYQRCQHQHDGCAIYAQRPNSCRAYQCYWLAHPEVEDRFRPDRCGVVIEEVDVPSRALLVMADPSTPFRWKVPPVSDLLQTFLDDNRPVCIIGPPGLQPPVLGLPRGMRAAAVWKELMGAVRRVLHAPEKAKTAEGQE